jgi:lipoprotein Spr
VKKHAASNHSTGSSTEENTAGTASLKTYQKKYISELGTASTEITDLKLYQFIDDWMNAPYKYGGLSKKGIDCSGLSALLMEEVYQKKIGGSSADIFNQADPVSKEKLKEGDLVFFKIKSTRISHMGVYLVNDKFIHATTKAGVIISDLNDPYYREYFYKAGRIK